MQYLSRAPRAFPRAFGRTWSSGQKLRSLTPTQLRWLCAPGQVHKPVSTPSSVAGKALGESGSLDWRLFFQAQADNVSIWHDIPLFCSETGCLNYVNEIGLGDRAKMECATKEEWHPIKQDVKKGKLRFFTYGDLPFNYGMLPQTWEDPTKRSEFTDSDTTGDNDPVDVVELSDTPMQCGEITQVKVVGVLGLIDEGETDWKVLGINKNHPKAAEINDIEDVDKVLGEGTCEKVKHWFQYYKTTDGKPENSFTWGGQFKGRDEAMKIIKECNHHWMSFLLGKVESKLEKSSSVHKLLVSKGVTSEEEAFKLVV